MGCQNPLRLASTHHGQVLTITVLQAQVAAKDMCSLCEQFSAKMPLTEVSLGSRTVAFDSTAPGTHMYAQWRAVNMRPCKKIVPQGPLTTTQAGMAGMAAEFDSPIDQYVLGNLAGKMDVPRPDYCPGIVTMEPCTETSVVYVMSGKNKKLTDGTLKLGPSSYLVLDESCTAVEFRNVNVEGGYPSDTPYIQHMTVPWNHIDELVQNSLPSANFRM